MWILLMQLLINMVRYVFINLNMSEDIYLIFTIYAPNDKILLNTFGRNIKRFLKYQQYNNSW